ncbi:hypothetical protein C8R45DRAFT_1221834 [Mycena sanguinolenta]|nr:hypothetical protein C8R45DRAFT_1221834 [Mycena sanguinolenta]
MGYSMASSDTLTSSGPQTSHPSTARASVGAPIFIRKTTTSKRDSLFDSPGTFTSMADSYDEKDSASSSPSTCFLPFGTTKPIPLRLRLGIPPRNSTRPSRRRSKSLLCIGTASPRPPPAHTRPTSVVLLPLPKFVRDAADIV